MGIRYLTAILFLFFISAAQAAPPNKNAKSKFYNFDEQLINGEIRKPRTIYTSVRERAKFERLLKLKKSFLPALFRTSKNKIFK
jgi:hypothetical protein